MPVNAKFSADILLVAVSVLAGAGWLFSKEALAGMEPLFFVGVRFASAAVIVGLIGGRAVKRLPRKQIAKAILTGSVLALQILLWIVGLSFTTHLGVGAFLASVAFILVPIVGRIFFGARSYLSTWVAVLIAFAGLALLMVKDGFTPTIADAFLLASAVAAAVHYNLNNRFAASVPAMPLTVVQLATVGVIALTLAFSISDRPLSTPSYSLLMWLSASVLLATCLRFFLFVTAVRLAPVGHGAVVLTLEPVWAALLGAAWYGERMTALQALGCGLVFAALLVSFYGQFRRRRL